MRQLVLNTNSDQSRRALYDFLKSLSGKFAVTIEPVGRRRSLEQNARYWVILTYIAEQLRDESGKMYSPETWHEWAKATFIGKDTLIVDGEPTLIPKSSTKLRVMDFADYMTKLEAWAIDHGVNFYEPT